MGQDNKELSGPDFAKGIALSELPEGRPLLGHAGGEAVVLVRRGAEVAAIGATCTHYNGPLAEGLVSGDTIRCPWHHACFDLRTGENLGAPALDAVACYAVRLAGGRATVGDKVAPPSRPRPPVSPSSVVLVGAGTAGAAAAEALRRHGYDGPVTMIGDEPLAPVDRPNLSKDYLAGNAPEDWVSIR